ncbi:phage baseplate assembly protein V [Acidocella sp. MX-AZ03]|uniref:phage baseplate assembly protein V n=1 Tax=Acidocella sp. MX-AZ03 TaxID=2697363 RepID=UPI0022DDAF0E|nr:phage baseplate assembly protein V [Acidocella sp. MX-AZ03]WBO60547.1 phage baseplate assembly protein V [Acidocella sp. MX-AZ03]
MVDASHPWISARAGGDAEIWAPDQGEQAVVFSPFGDPAQGVALVGIFQMTMPAPAATAGQRVVKYKDGGIESYDRTASKKVISVPAGAASRCRLAPPPSSSPRARSLSTVPMSSPIASA